MSYYQNHTPKDTSEQSQVNKLLTEYASNQNLNSIPELHELFWPSILNCKNNIEIIFQTKLQIQTYKSQKKQIKSISEYEKINSEISPNIQNVGKWKTEHPKAQEIFDDDVKSFDLINLRWILKRNICLSYESITIITKDTQICIEKTIKNYKKYLLTKDQALNQDKLAWCPKQFQENIVGVTDDTENQTKIFIGALSVYKQSLIDRFNKITVLDALDFDLSISYILHNDISALNKLQKENEHFQATQKFNKIEHEIEMKIKGLYLDMSDNDINLNQSYAFIKDRREEVSKLLNTKIINLKQMNKETLKNKLRSAIHTQKHSTNAKEATFKFVVDSDPVFNVKNDSNITIEVNGHSLFDHFNFKTIKMCEKEQILRRQ